MKTRHQKVLKVKPPEDIRSLLEAFSLEGDPLGTRDFKGKLTAVFRPDVAGHSRMTGQDEAAGGKTFETYNQVAISPIKHHQEPVIDSPGDNILPEFRSVVSRNDYPTRH